ncbi:hypothetical protein ACKVMT_17910 [Halobacteriales archaeon Cl-PHB]
MTHSSTDMAETPGGPDGLTDDQRYQMLANERRRVTLAVLADRETSLSLEALAAAVASREDEEHDRVATSLHHVHLPKLTAAGVLEYDPRSTTVRCRSPDPLAALLD